MWVDGSSDEGRGLRKISPLEGCEQYEGGAPVPHSSDSLSCVCAEWGTPRTPGVVGYGECPGQWKCRPDDGFHRPHHSRCFVVPLSLAEPRRQRNDGKNIV